MTKNDSVRAEADESSDKIRSSSVAKSIDKDLLPVKGGDESAPADNEESRSSTSQTGGSSSARTSKDTEVTKAGVNQKPLRVHFYLGPVARTEIVYQNSVKPDEKTDAQQFLSTKIAILKLFGILLDGRDKKNAQNYVLKHINGGVINSV